MWKSLQRWVLEPTAAIDPVNYRTYVSFNIGTLSAMGVHLAILPLFYLLGATELLWVNIPSHLAYLAALWANRRGHHTTTIAIALAELVVHQAFCVHSLGWEAGFQYYIMVIPALVFFLPTGRLTSKMVLLACSAAGYVMILAWSHDVTPLHTIGRPLLFVVGYVNIGVVFGLLGFFGFTYRRAAEIAEARLAESERRLTEERLLLLEAAVSAAQDVVVITDLAGDIEFVNASFTRVTGYLPREAIGNNLRLLGSGQHPPEFFAELWGTISDGQSWTGRIVNRHKDGELFVENATLTPIKGEDGTVQHYLGIMQDVTESERASEQLAKTEEQLRQAQKMEAIGTLAGGIAHDFNNLLTSILATAEFLREDLQTGEARIEDVDEIRRAGERAAILTRQLLAYSRKQVLAPKVLDVSRVITEIQALLRRTLPERVEIIAQLSSDELLFEADEAQIGQVLVNLAVNASDAMPDGGELLIETERVSFPEAVSAYGSVIPAGHYVGISVSDTGHGIAPELLHEVFEPFFTTKGVGEGTGLGLSTVYGIIKQSGGHLTVHSKVGFGTTFRLYLPATTGEPAPIPETNGDWTLARGSETLLMVEDDPSVRNVILRVLNGCGYKTLVAADGEEALRILDDYTGPVHLLFTDVMMPGIDGATLASRVKARHPEIVVLFASGYPGQIIARHGDFISGKNFLPKPYTGEALAGLVRELLDA